MHKTNCQKVDKKAIVMHLTNLKIKNISDKLVIITKYMTIL